MLENAGLKYAASKCEIKKNEENPRRKNARLENTETNLVINLTIMPPVCSVVINQKSDQLHE